jgi:hypothetical protein
MDVTTTASGAGKFETRFYDIIMENEFGRVKGHFGPVHTLAFHPDGKRWGSPRLCFRTLLQPPCSNPASKLFPHVTHCPRHHSLLIAHLTPTPFALLCEAPYRLAASPSHPSPSPRCSTHQLPLTPLCWGPLTFDHACHLWLFPIPASRRAPRTDTSGCTTYPPPTWWLTTTPSCPASLKLR